MAGGYPAAAGGRNRFSEDSLEAAVAALSASGKLQGSRSK
jgi:hypothetical protein